MNFNLITLFSLFGGSFISRIVAEAPTYDQFCAAVQSFSEIAEDGQKPPKPSEDKYNTFVKFVSANMVMMEQAMFLAHVVYGTLGLQYLEEIACKGNTTATETCPYGKYYARGYIQLAWEFNYRDASKDIYGNGDVLVKNPELVAKEEDAWRTAFWFWNRKVRPVIMAKEVLSKVSFGHTIAIINGPNECPDKANAKKRLKVFNAIKKLWNIPGPEGTMVGCLAEENK